MGFSSPARLLSIEQNVKSTLVSVIMSKPIIRLANNLCQIPCVLQEPKNGYIHHCMSKKDSHPPFEGTHPGMQMQMKLVNDEENSCSVLKRAFFAGL